MFWLFLHFLLAMSNNGTYATTNTGRPKIHMIGDKPKVSLGNVDGSLYTHLIVLRNEYQKNGVDMPAYTPVEYNYLGILAKIFIIPSRKNQIIQENVFNETAFHRFAIAMKQTQRKLDRTLKIHFVINNMISDIYNNQKRSTICTLWCW